MLIVSEACSEHQWLVKGDVVWANPVQWMGVVEELHVWDVFIGGGDLVCGVVSEESTQIVIIRLGVECQHTGIAQQCSILTWKPETKLLDGNLQLHLSYKVMTY